MWSHDYQLRILKHYHAIDCGREKKRFKEKQLFHISPEYQNQFRVVDSNSRTEPVACGNILNVFIYSLISINLSIDCLID